MDKQFAEVVQRLSLEAIRSLSSVLQGAKDHCSTEEFETLKKGIGLSIGRIQMDVLEHIYREYPDLDDLRD